MYIGGERANCLLPQGHLSSFSIHFRDRFSKVGRGNILWLLSLREVMKITQLARFNKALSSFHIECPFSAPSLPSSFASSSSPNSPHQRFTIYMYMYGITKREALFKIRICPRANRLLLSGKCCFCMRFRLYRVSYRLLSWRYHDSNMKRRFDT